MNYGVILASGKGKRVKDNIDIPKQFREVNNIPIVVYTIRKFLDTCSFDYIFIAVSKEYVDFIKQIINKYFDDNESKKIVVTIGGKERIDSIINVINEIEKVNVVGDDDVVVIHDAVRPFVTERIISDNIMALEESSAVDTVVAATDTIVESLDGKVISNIPNRAFMYQGQTPQSFNIEELINLYNSLTSEEKDILTDACKIFSIKGYKVAIVNGESYNIKITNITDLKIADALSSE